MPDIRNHIIDVIEDVIEGDVVGAAYHSLVKKLQAHIGNAKRSSAPRIKKYDTVEQRAAVQDTYGCIKWNMKFMPVTETPESQQEQKHAMKVLSDQTNHCSGLK